MAIPYKLLCHCEAQSAVAIPDKLSCHCEERSDVAIPYDPYPAIA